MSRELDAELAIALGGMKWVNNAGGTCRYIVPVDMEHGGIPADMALPLCGTWNPKTPEYSTDLNACRLAEQQMVGKGLGRKYAALLKDSIRSLLIETTGWGAGWEMALLMAPAEARCKAMLSVLEAGA